MPHDRPEEVYRPDEVTLRYREMLRTRHPHRNWHCAAAPFSWYAQADRQEEELIMPEHQSPPRLNLRPNPNPRIAEPAERCRRLTTSSAAGG